MSFEERLMMVSSSFPIIQQEDDGCNYHKIRNSLSRLSVCTTSVHEEQDKEPTKNHQTYDLSVSVSESFDGAEADGEVSDHDRGKENVQESDSDKETPNFYSLPVTQSRRRKKLPLSGELESNKDGNKCNLRRQRRVNKEKKKNKGVDEGETVLTRAKGGDKSLRMGLEEVKACRDLGFDLEVPGRISVSTTGSNFDTQTSSGGNSPIATWRISSPGDDPKEVKARLKVWAQAVALASTSRQV